MLLGEEDQDYLCMYLHVFVHTYKEIEGVHWKGREEGWW